MSKSEAVVIESIEVRELLRFLFYLDILNKLSLLQRKHSKYMYAKCLNFPCFITYLAACMHAFCMFYLYASLGMKHAHITLTDLVSLVLTHLDFPADQLTTFSFHISVSNTVVSSNYCLEHVRQKTKLKYLSSFSVCLRHTPRLLIKELRYCQRIPPVIATSTT